MKRYLAPAFTLCLAFASGCTGERPTLTDQVATASTNPYGAERVCWALDDMEAAIGVRHVSSAAVYQALQDDNLNLDSEQTKSIVFAVGTSVDIKPSEAFDTSETPSPGMRAFIAIDEAKAKLGCP